MEFFVVKTIPQLDPTALFLNAECWGSVRLRVVLYPAFVSLSAHYIFSVFQELRSYIFSYSLWPRTKELRIEFTNHMMRAYRTIHWNQMNHWWNLSPTAIRSFFPLETSLEFPHTVDKAMLNHGLTPVIVFLSKSMGSMMNYTVGPLLLRKGHYDLLLLSLISRYTFDSVHR